MRKSENSMGDVVVVWLMILSCAVFMLAAGYVAWSKSGSLKGLWALLGGYVGAWLWGAAVIALARIFEFARDF